MDFGQRIRDLRTKGGLTQTELAERVGVSQAEIQRLETSQRRLKLDVAKKIAGTLGVDISAIINEEGSTPIHSLVAWNIRILREKSKLTQSQLAEKIGMSQSQIQKLEMGDRSLKIEALEKIADALGVSFWDLVVPVSDFSLRKVHVTGVVNFLEKHEAQGGIIIEYPEHVAFETQRADLLAFWVWDDSMSAYVPEKSVIVVAPSITDPKALDMQLVVALVDGRLIFGRWEGHVNALWAISSGYDNGFILKATFGTQFLGRVISFTKTFK